VTEEVELAGEFEAAVLADCLEARSGMAKDRHESVAIESREFW
jgi:hypothetical protein